MATFGSSNTPLQANGVVTLGPIQADRAQRVVGSIFADQTGSLKVQQSFDGGNNWDISQTIAVVASTAASFEIDILAPIVQLVYTNGGTNQGAFRLYTRVFNSGS